MNYEAAILYAMQKMREIGKTPEQYHFEPVRVVPANPEEAHGYFEIKAYNEIYILINPQNYYGLFILSDNSAFNSEDLSQSGVPEFTGVIRFIKAVDKWNFEVINADGTIGKPIPVEFLRVVIY